MCLCGGWMSRVNYVRYIRPRGVSEEEAVVSGERMRKTTRWIVAECQMYGSTLSYPNMTRHQRRYRVWNPGVLSSS